MSIHCDVPFSDRSLFANFEVREVHKEQFSGSDVSKNVFALELGNVIVYIFKSARDRCAFIVVELRNRISDLMQ